jgi:hypothetical protein
MTARVLPCAGKRDAEIFGCGEFDEQLRNLERAGDAEPRDVSRRASRYHPSSAIAPLSGLR